jgi:peptidoglycan lytic transglycosylase G
MTETVCPDCKPRLWWLLVVLVILALAAVALVYGKYRDFSFARITLPQDHYVLTVVPGMSLRQLAHELHEHGIIEYPRFFVQLGRTLEADRKLKAGEYVLEPELTPRSLLALVTDGKVVQYALTIVEGQTFAELRKRIEQDPVLEQTLRGLDDDALMARLGKAGEKPEGRFLADTYHFPRHTTDANFLQRAYSAMEKTIQEEWGKRAPDLPLASPYEALILASIVEKETGIAEERPVIAGVFIRRLKQGMKLQTDPTVIYGLGDAFDGNIRRDDLVADNPYNTYTREGLPPTPIATPGREAIHAVLHPAGGDSLFFVASGGGRHYFSATLDEHNLAVDKFQRGKRDITLPGEKVAR